MRFAEALRLEPGRIVTFTGAGGKTSALRRLAEERAGDERALLTVTTRLAYSERDLAAIHLIATSTSDLKQIPDLLSQHGSVLLTGAADRTGGKLDGVDPNWVEEAGELARKAAAFVAVEGDGAKGRWIKAPAPHEPVVPARSDLLVPTLNLGALGRPLDDEIAHRPERVSDLTGLGLGESIEARHALALLTDPQGGLRGRPESAEVRIMLTGRTESAAQGLVVDGLLAEPRVRAVVHVPDEIGEQSVSCYGRTAAVVLAAGGASRMGELKQVLTWRGRPLVAHAVDAARAAGLNPIVVVTGAQPEQVRAALGDGEDLRLAHNPDWESGQSTSMQRGVEAVRDDVEAAVFLLADMPLVDEVLIERLVAKHRNTLAPIVAPRADGRFGNPVLFDRAIFDDLMGVTGDQGGRALYEMYPVIGVPAGEGSLLDLDEPQDLARLERAADDDPAR